VTTRIGVLLSGGGRTLANLLSVIDDGRLDAKIVCVIADRDCFGLVRAEAARVPFALSRDDDAIYALLAEHQVDLVCLCGYLRLLPIRPGWERRVLNIHPALLPRHGGAGFYGDRVHRSVLESGDKESGCTVHYCDEHYDQGEVLLQRKVPVLGNDTSNTLAARVFEAECRAYPEAIRLWQQERRGD